MAAHLIGRPACDSQRPSDPDLPADQAVASTPVAHDQPTDASQH